MKKLAFVFLSGLCFSLLLGADLAPFPKVNSDSARDRWLPALNAKSEELAKAFHKKVGKKELKNAFDSLIAHRGEAAFFHRIDTSRADYILLDEEWDFEERVYRFRESHFFTCDSQAFTYLHSRKSVGYYTYWKTFARKTYCEKGVDSTLLDTFHYKNDKDIPCFYHGDNVQRLKSVKAFFDIPEAIIPMPPYVYLESPEPFSCSNGYFESLFYIESQKFSVPFVRTRTLISNKEKQFYQVFEYPIRSHPIILH